MTYHQAYTDITNGINPLKKDPFSSFFDFGDTAGSQTYTYNYNPSQRQSRGRAYKVRRGGCLGRILKIIFIIFIIRLIISLVSGLFYSSKTYYYTPHYRQSYSQSQEFGDNSESNSNSNDASNYFGSQNGEAHNQ